MKENKEENLKVELKVSEELEHQINSLLQKARTIEDDLKNPKIGQKSKEVEQKLNEEEKMNRLQKLQKAYIINRPKKPTMRKNNMKITSQKVPTKKVPKRSQSKPLHLVPQEVTSKIELKKDFIDVEIKKSPKPKPVEKQPALVVPKLNTFQFVFFDPQYQKMLAELFT